MASDTPRRAVVIDTDPGIDDALAILLALRAPELEVAGLTTVHGNVPLEATTRNVFRILGLAGRLDVPVYRGAERPLRREPFHAAEVHGPDGLGATDLPSPVAEPQGDAVPFLVESLRDRSGELDVVCLGPLTNLALAEQEAPGILARARRVVVMGGAVEEPGNVTPAAEFNFFADPDAARTVVRAGAPLTLVPLDVTHRVTLNEAALAGAADTPVARFTADAVGDCMGRSDSLAGERRFYMHDPLAVGVAMAPDLCGCERLWVDVETRGELTAGQLVADRRAFRDNDRRRGVPCECAMRVQADRFLAIFLERVLR